MTIIAEITPIEQADRLAIRELVDAYAHCADRRDADGQKALFTEDTHFVVYMERSGFRADTGTRWPRGAHARVR